MTATATAVKSGPFAHGGWPHGVLYELSVPYEYEGQEFSHLLVSAVSADEWGPDEVVALVSDAEANVTLGDEFPYVEEGTKDRTRALKALGYEAN